MKSLVVICISVTCFVSAAWCARNNQCKSYDDALQDINYELDQESRKHHFYFPYDKYTYIDKTKHVLKELNTRIKQNQRNQGSDQCSSLENAVKVKSVKYGVEIEGFDDSITRFNKLIDFLDERNQNQRNDTDRKQVVSQQIALAYVDLRKDLEHANATILRLNQTNSELSRNYLILQKEYHKIYAKLLANAAAIHGKSGNITGLHNETVTIKPELLNLPTTTTMTTLNGTDTEMSSEADPATNTTAVEPFKVDVRASPAMGTRSTKGKHQTSAESDH